MTWNDFPLPTGRISSAMSLCLHPPPACDISHPAPASGRRVLIRAYRAACRLAESPRRDRQSLRRPCLPGALARCHSPASTRASTRRLAGRSLEAAGRQRARRGRERRRRPAGARLPWGHRRAAACRRPSHALCWGHCAAGRRRCPRPVPRRFQKRLNRESISVLDEPPSPLNVFLRFSLF